MPREIGSAEAQNEDERGVVWTREVITDKPGHVVVRWDVTKPKATGNIGQQEENDEVAASLSAEPDVEVVIQVYASENTEGNENTVGNLQNCSDQS